MAGAKRSGLPNLGRKKSGKVVLGDEIREQMVAEYKDGVSANAIAHALGINPMVVARLLRESGVEVRSNRRVSADEHRRMIEMSESGKSRYQIAKELGTTVTTVEQHLAREDWSDGRASRREITKEDRKRFLEMSEQGMSLSEIGRRTGRTTQVVSKALGGARRQGRNVTEHEHERIIALYNEGVPVKQIAKRMHVSTATCYAHLRAAGVPRKDKFGRPPEGE